MFFPIKEKTPWARRMMPASHARRWTAPNESSKDNPPPPSNPGPPRTISQPPLRHLSMLRMPKMRTGATVYSVRQNVLFHPYVRAGIRLRLASE